MEDWLAWRGPDIEYLFCPIYQGKAVNRDLSATTVKRLIKTSAQIAGLDKEEVDAFRASRLKTESPDSQ